jgi:hypothetical protein
MVEAAGVEQGLPVRKLRILLKIQYVMQCKIYSNYLRCPHFDFSLKYFLVSSGSPHMFSFSLRAACLLLLIYLLFQQRALLPCHT